MRSSPAVFALLALLALLAFPLSASAAEIGGVNMPDSTSVAGKALPLRGVGLRKALVLKVYAAALYTSNTGGADAVIKDAGLKSMKMHMMIGLDGSKIADSIEKGFEKNSASQMGALRERLDTLKTMFPRANKGDVVELAWDGSKTDITLNGTSIGTIAGADFAGALFAVWLGPDPVTEDLKSGLLGS